LLFKTKFLNLNKIHELILIFFSTLFFASFFSGRKYASILGCGVTSTDTGVVEFKLLLVTVDVKCWSIDGDCFLFEGWFKNVKDLHYGTANLSSQIANNLSFKLKVHFELNDITIRKPELKAFVEQISTNKDNTRLLLHEPRFTKQIYLTFK